MTPDQVKDYKTAATFFDLRSKDEPVKLYNNTYLHRTRPTSSRYLAKVGTIYHITLHSKEIITFFPSGYVSLDTRGFNTTTTMDRLNRFTHCHVRTVRGEWIIHVTPAFTRKTRHLHAFHNRMKFYDGMTVRPFATYPLARAKRDWIPGSGIEGFRRPWTEG